MSPYDNCQALPAWETALGRCVPQAGKGAAMAPCSHLMDIMHIMDIMVHHAGWGGSNGVGNDNWEFLAQKEITASQQPFFI